MNMEQAQMHAMLKQVLRNQVRLAYQIAQCSSESTSESQDRANHIGLDTQRMFNQMNFGYL